jgi:signal peptidase I
MLVASYTERMDQTMLFSVTFAGAGLVIGAVLGYLRGRDADARENLLRDNLEWADTGFSAILLASVVMFFVVQAFKIPSGSMRMTFVEGDHLFVNKFIYGVPIPFTDKKVFPIHKPRPGDIIIFRFPSDDKTSPHYNKDFIKRLIATEGQTVKIVNKHVFVDDVEQLDSHAQHVDPDIFPSMGFFSPEEFQAKWAAGELANIGGNDIRDNFGPVKVPPGDVFAMGDNRDRSFDSRFWGPLPVHEIKGKAWLVYWPPKRIKLVH